MLWNKALDKSAREKSLSYVKNSNDVKMFKTQGIYLSFEHFDIISIADKSTDHDFSSRAFRPVCIQRKLKLPQGHSRYVTRNGIV